MKFFLLLFCISCWLYSIKMIKEFLTDTIKEHVYSNMLKYLNKNYNMLSHDDFKLGKNFYNSRCHINSVQDVMEKNSEKVYLVIIYNKNSNPKVIVHFINQDKNEQYVDNTFGWTFKEFKYFCVREIKPEEFDNISNILGNMKNELKNKNCNILFRMYLTLVGEEDIC